MKTQSNQSTVKKVLAMGLAAVALAWPARAQYVSTVVPASSGLNEPSAITVDGAGNAYIADSANNRIAIYNPVTEHLSVLAGSTAPGTNNGSYNAEFFNPTGIVYAPARGGLVVVDQGNQLIRYVGFNGAVSNLAGVNSALGGFQDGPAATAQFSFPTSVAIGTNGSLYIADSGNGAIRILDTNNVVSTLQINNYTFDFPEGLTLDSSNNLWVADTLNNAICVISNVSPASTSATLIAGADAENGTNDSVIAANARFNLPSGLYWDNVLGALLVADSGNNTIREVYGTNLVAGSAWGVRTIAGSPLKAGLADGSAGAALFSQPASFALDVTDAGLYVVDSANSAIRVFLPTPPLPPVSAPQFGFVTFPAESGLQLSQFNAATNAVLNNFNPPLIAIVGEPGTETYVTYGPTPADVLDNTIPTPGPTTGFTPEVYRGDGLSVGASAPSIVQPMPDMTLFAVSQAPGRRASPVVTARFKFQCANPAINGLNAADVQVLDQTLNAELYYTTDGSTPTNDGSSGIAVSPGTILSIDLQSNVLLQVRAFENGFEPSGVSFEELSVTNFVANQLTFGFPTGQEGSSEFIGAAGQRFVAPVTLTLLSGAKMYTLQFNVTVTNPTIATITNGATNFNTAPPPGLTFNFTSMLETPGPSNYFYAIPPMIFDGTSLTNGMFTNDSEGLLGVGWVERYTKTNLYNTLAQDLITYSSAKDDLFQSSAGKVIVGGYSFVVPKTATNGQKYQIQLGRPSASADGIGVIPAIISAPTTGPLGPGNINAVKDVTVGSARYLVGDVNNFRWFNAGDFGDGNLDASDVEEVFQTAVYGLNSPPPSDMLDAMDSSNATTNGTPGLYSAIFIGQDPAANALIDSMAFGDGVLDISDVYVTFRRSLDPSLAWYIRYWSGGQLNAVATSNAPQKAVAKAPPAKTGVAVPHTLTIAADTVIASGAGGTAVVPIRVLAGDPTGLPIHAAMFDVLVLPLDGSPALTTPISFDPNPNLGAPYASISKATGDLANLWVGTNAGITGAGVIGNLNITLPEGASANSSYQVVISKFSASPNGLGVFKSTVQNGLVTLSDRSASSWNDGISDAWRLLHFATISNPSSAANADPDGDGASNWQEYLAGTDPLSAASVFKLQTGPNAGASAFTLQWQTVVGKNYTLQSSSSATAGSWTTLLNKVSGSGNPMNWTDTSGTQAKFFRAIAQ